METKADQKSVTIEFGDGDALTFRRPTITEDQRVVARRQIRGAKFTSTELWKSLDDERDDDGNVPPEKHGEIWRDASEDDLLVYYHFANAGLEETVDLVQSWRRNGEDTGLTPDELRAELVVSKSRTLREVVKQAKAELFELADGDS